jgi:hypothetical protein
LGTISRTAVQQLRQRWAPVAHDSVLRRALATSGRRPPADTVHKILQALTTPNDSGMPVELWSADGRRVAFVGDDIRALETRQPAEIPPGERARPPRDGLDSIKTADSLQIGMLYPAGGAVWPPFRSSTATPRWATSQQRRPAANPQTEQTLRS